MNSSRKKLTPEPSYPEVIDAEARDEIAWEAYCKQPEAQMRGSAWLVLAVPADVEAALMQEKSRSVVH